MKLKTMLYGLTLMLGCFVLASCVNDEEGPCLPDGKTQIVFSLVMQDNAQTRAWGDYVPQAKDRDNGKGKENDIDLSTLKLLIFDNEGAYVGTLSKADIDYIPHKTGTLPYEETVYECIGTINPDKITLNNGVYKFVFLANYTGSIPTDQQGKITWKSLKTAVFTPSLANFNSNAELIPMWGVMTTPALTLVPGNRQDLGDVALLRAMSKVTVALTGTGAGMNDYGYISKVEVTNYNTKGYVVPKLKAYSSVTSTIALDEEECVNENTADAATKLFINGSTDTKELTFYLLDYENTKEGKTAAELIVTLGKTDANGNPVMEGEGENAKPVTTTFDFAPIKFCEYSGGVPTTTAYDIVRNHYYQFNINSVNDDGGLFIVPYVLPWDYDAKNSSEFTTKGSSVLTVLDRTSDGTKFQYKICNSSGVGQNPDKINWGDAWAAIAYDPDFVPGGQNNPQFNTLLELTVSFEHDSHMVLESSDVNFGFVYRKPKTSTQDPDSYSEILDALTIDDTTAVYNEADGTYTVTYYVVPKPTSSEGEKTEVSLIMYSAGMATKMPYNSSILPGSSDNTGAYFYRVSSSVWDSINWYTQNV